MIICMVGLPGSGKSSWTQDFLNKNKDFVRVNRDAIRGMLYGISITQLNFYWRISNEETEKLVLKTEQSIVKLLIKNNKNLIIDDCNCSINKISLWKNLADKNGIPFKIQFMDTPMHECILRDTNRKRSVGKKYIQEMALKLNKLLDNEQFKKTIFS
jgi:predicted kinase